MCIMEVRPGQKSATIAQAMAHNLSTIERDLDMFKPLMEARGETALLASIEDGHSHMKAAYARFLECFVHEIENEVRSGDNPDERATGSERVHVHPHDHDMIEEAMTAAAHEAEKYETR